MTYIHFKIGKSLIKIATDPKYQQKMAFQAKKLQIALSMAITSITFVIKTDTDVLQDFYHYLPNHLLQNFGWSTIQTAPYVLPKLSSSSFSTGGSAVLVTSACAQA